MYKLTIVPESPLLDEVMRRLDEAGIHAVMVSQRTIVEIDLGLPSSAAVYVADEADLVRARTILAEVHPSMATTRCLGCGYHLAGSSGEATCPECGCKQVGGRPESEPPSQAIACPGCGEEVPGNFEVCWNCGGAVGGEPGAVRRDG